MTETRGVVIPAELAEEVRQHPERFRPEIPPLGVVLVVASPSGLQPTETAGIATTGLMGEASAWGVLSGLAVVDRGPGLPAGLASGWLLVGSTDDPDSPRPAEGDRIVALDWGTSQDSPGLLVDVSGVQAGVVEFVHADVGAALCRSWAILPPAPIAEPGLADDDHALTALGEALRVTHDDAARSDAIGKALHSGWLAGRVSELRELLRTDEVSDHPEWTEVLERRLDALAEMAEVDETVIRAQILDDREARAAEEAWAVRSRNAAPWLTLLLAVAAVAGAAGHITTAAMLAATSVVSVAVLFMGRETPRVTTGAVRDTRALAVACPRPGCAAKVRERCDVGFVAFQHPERYRRYADVRHDIEQREHL